MDDLACLEKINHQQTNKALVVVDISDGSIMMYVQQLA
jgi:hypothetical protein